MIEVFLLLFALAIGYWLLADGGGVMKFISGIIFGALVGSFLGYFGGLDDGSKRAFNYCVERQARTEPLSVAREQCSLIVGRRRR